MVPKIPVHKRVRVSCLSQASYVSSSWPATHVVSLLDPDLEDSKIPKPTDSEQYVFRFFDQERADATQHFGMVINQILVIVQSVILDPKNRLLIHCHAGVSRSTALAFGVLSIIHGTGQEAQAFSDLLTVSCKPWPNRRIVEVIDDALGREGRMLVALDEYRSLHPFRLASYRRLNKKRGIVSTVKR